MEVGEALPEILTLSLLFILITSVEAGFFYVVLGVPFASTFHVVLGLEASSFSPPPVQM